jgi:hypothetical protein
MTGFTSSLEVWNKRFSTTEYVFGEEPNAFLVAQAPLLGTGVALALADGEGRNSVWLAQQGLTVDAFDFSAPAVEKAKILAKKRQVHVNFSCTDWQSLKPGGTVVIQGYGKNQINYNTGGPGKLEHLYDEDMLRQAFADYDLLVCESYESTINEGAGHSGMSALIGFVARKP